MGDMEIINRSRLLSHALQVKVCLRYAIRSIRNTYLSSYWSPSPVNKWGGVRIPLVGLTFLCICATATPCFSVACQGWGWLRAGWVPKMSLLGVRLRLVPTAGMGCCWCTVISLLLSTTLPGVLNLLAWLFVLVGMANCTFEAWVGMEWKSLYVGNSASLKTPLKCATSKGNFLYPSPRR